MRMSQYTLGETDILANTITNQVTYHVTNATYIKRFIQFIRIHHDCNRTTTSLHSGIQYSHSLNYGFIELNNIL
ncbi:hypothetical protein BMS3Bbin11_00075 [bacterium BMS3Bbin11]|nr:hypothetical protein BMS3Bbin11_00075 [bacterium BMS3Bbin11]